jgi:predicted ATPase/class 3 adenylate cyclase/Tfp pilus assembly protein PilF
MQEAASMTAITTHPSGTVTFLFTDIEDSTRLWEQHSALMKSAHHRQEAILLDAIREHDGYAYKMVGDAFQAAFDTAPQALAAAFDAQRALHSEQWGDIGDLRVRMGIHTGVTEERAGDYTGPVLNRVARLMSAGHGGQILISLTTQELVRDHLPFGVTLRDMGERRLKDLTRPEHIFQLLHPDLPSDFPPLKTLDNHPNNLPLQPNPLIDREKDVASIRSKLLRDEVCLLTLIGPGGIGKTRLALQAAAEMLDDFPNGVFFVNLAPIVDPNLVAPTIAYTLDLREAGGQPIADTLKDYLKDKRLLLVLDNFEHVVGAAPTVAALFKSAPHLKALVTSREPLRLSMEHEHGVPPLSVPDPNKLTTVEAVSKNDAVSMFVQRAVAVKPGFEVNNQNAPAVAEICYRLDGIPLAIELAAARIKVLPPQAIRERLGSRLRLLTGGARDVPARQRTLRNTIEWSYDLLTAEEKQLFRRMAVFRGGRTLEAADAVCNAYADTLVVSAQGLEIDVLDGISSLTDKSLMYVTERTGGEARYSMFETIQEYSWEKLQECGELMELQRQHALYFMRLAEEVEPRLRGAHQVEWLARLEDEHDNIRVALRWAREAGNPESLKTGLRLAGAIWRFWMMRGYFSEGREQLTGLLEIEAVQAGQAGQTLQLEQGEQATKSQVQPTLLHYRAKALNGAGALAYSQGDYTSARSLYEESLFLRRKFGDQEGIAGSLNNLGNVAEQQGNYASARSLYEESLSLTRELGDKWRIAASLNNLGNVAQQQGDYASARSLYEESLSLTRELGDKWGIANSLNNLGLVAQQQWDHFAARSLYEESLSLHRELGDKFGIAASLAGLGGLAVARVTSTNSTGSVERGVRLLGAVEAMLETIGAVLESGNRIPYERAIAASRQQLGEDAFKRVWKEGRAMGMDEAIAYALEMPALQ